MRKLITGILIIAIIAVGIGSFAFYKLGDRVFDEIIDSQITELEKTVDQPAPPAQAPAATPATPDTKAAVVVTKEKLETIKESVTPKDKVTAAKIVLTELNKSDISQLTQLSSGGITAEEKTEIKEIVYSKLSPQEIDEIKAMYYKYMK